MTHNNTVSSFQIHVKFSGNLLKCEVISALALASDKSAAEMAANDDTKSVVAGSVVGATLSFMGGTGTIVFRPFSDNRQAYLLRRRNEKNPYPKGRVTFFTGMAGVGAERVLFETKIDLTKFLEVEGGGSRKTMPTRIGEHS